MGLLAQGAQGAKLTSYACRTGHARLGWPSGLNSTKWNAAIYVAKNRKSTKLAVWCCIKRLISPPVSFASLRVQLVSRLDSDFSIRDVSWCRILWASY